MAKTDLSLRSKRLKPIPFVAAKLHKRNHVCFIMRQLNLLWFCTGPKSKPTQTTITLSHGVQSWQQNGGWQVWCYFVDGRSTAKLLTSRDCSHACCGNDHEKKAIYFRATFIHFKQLILHGQHFEGAVSWRAVGMLFVFRWVYFQTFTLLDSLSCKLSVVRRIKFNSDLPSSILLKH